MPVGKKLRFEVFKRDKFTCTYCGRKAPDVVLHCDHIEPVAEGGTDTLLNLTTSCFDCNSGKGRRRLSDDSVVEKQRAQLEDLQERQEQIRMMIDWQRSLVGVDEEATEAVAAFWCELSGWGGLTEAGKQQVRKWIKKFSTEEVLDAMRAATHYFEFGEDGRLTEESAEHAFGKVGGCCAVTRAEKDNPYLKDVLYLRAIIRNRYNYIREREAREIIEEALRAGFDVDHLKSVALGNTTWTSWWNEMVQLVDGPEDESGAADA